MQEKFILGESWRIKGGAETPIYRGWSRPTVTAWVVRGCWRGVLLKAKHTLTMAPA